MIDFDKEMIKDTKRELKELQAFKKQLDYNQIPDSVKEKIQLRERMLRGDVNASIELSIKLGLYED